MKVNTRKSQIIHTFGVGAMQVNKEGVSLITCGLDYWFYDHQNQNEHPFKSFKRFTVTDERLKTKLDVSHFMMPPDKEFTDGEKTYRFQIPAKRFPYWHVCSNKHCQKLKKVSHSQTEEQVCDCSSYKHKMYQSRFVAICSNGHIQDFPWIEWLNANTNSFCDESCVLYLSGTGGTSSSDIRINCKTHGKGTSLNGIFKTYKDDETLMDSLLTKDRGINCRGHSPWLGDSYTQGCDKPLVAALRQATNVYFSKTVSSIYIPYDSDEISEEIREKYEALTTKQRSFVDSSPNLVEKVDSMQLVIGDEFLDHDIQRFFELSESANSDVSQSETEYKFIEYKNFKVNSLSEKLFCKIKNISEYENWVPSVFSSISQLDTLLVTNAMIGFDRYQPQSDRPTSNYINALRKNNFALNAAWLPAVQVSGEGIFIEFDNEKIRSWSDKVSQEDYFISLKIKASKNPIFQDIGELTPAYLLLHSFSHLLINQFIFDCGYSTASLKERIYYSDSDEYRMNGVLIYTAAGDSEGSLGGLVRMSSAGTLEKIIKNAVESARWCTSDPICSEIGKRGGQGPNGVNIAACHNCILLPETSCENFNSLLDRNTIISPTGDGSGYFDNVF